MLCLMGFIYLKQSQFVLMSAVIWTFHVPTEVVASVVRMLISLVVPEESWLSSWHIINFLFDETLFFTGQSLKGLDDFFLFAFFDEVLLITLSIIFRLTELITGSNPRCLRADFPSYQMLTNSLKEPLERWLCHQLRTLRKSFQIF